MIGEHVSTFGGARGDLWRCGFPLAAFNEPNAIDTSSQSRRSSMRPAQRSRPISTTRCWCFRMMSAAMTRLGSISGRLSCALSRAAVSTCSPNRSTPRPTKRNRVRQSPDTGISSFQIISAGADEAGSRLFDRELNDALRGVRRAVGRGSNFRRGGCRQSARCPDGRMDRRCDERLASPREDDAFHTETIHAMEGAYSGSYLLYQDVGFFTRPRRRLPRRGAECGSLSPAQHDCREHHRPPSSASRWPVVTN